MYDVRSMTCTDSIMYTDSIIQIIIEDPLKANIDLQNWALN